MKQKLNLDLWPRKNHFHFFRQFDEPFFGVTVKMVCTNAYLRAKQQSASFFLYYLHCSLVAANAIEPFRYQVAGDEVWVFDRIDASPTINRPDGTFGFGYLEYYPDFSEFLVNSLPAIQSVQESKELMPAVLGENVIHYSSIPWIDFSSLSHARSFSFRDSCPKISFGKMTEQNGQRSMPVSIHVHHALMDGFHVSQYIDLFQQKLNT